MLLSDPEGRPLHVDEAPLVFEELSPAFRPSGEAVAVAKSSTLSHHSSATPS